VANLESLCHHRITPKPRFCGVQGRTWTGSRFAFEEVVDRTTHELATRPFLTL